MSDSDRGICQAPLSMGFSRQEYWSLLLFPSPGDLPDLGVEPKCPALQADSLPTELKVHGIPQARILEWVAFPFSRGPSQTKCVECVQMCGIQKNGSNQHICRAEIETQTKRTDV